MEMEFQQAIYLAAQILATQGPQLCFPQHLEVHIPQERCDLALRPGAGKEDGGQVSGPQPSAPPP